ncbi:MAG: hypothetical protein ACQCN3_00780 [Candidatus Bathyarchaeia archaeon]
MTLDYVTPQGFPAPTVTQTIREKGYSYMIAKLRRDRVMHKETIVEGSRFLQVGGVVFVNFSRRTK